MQDTSKGSNPHRPLAASIAAILMLSAPLADAATTWAVNTCNEASIGSGTTGSLRYAAANAASGDTIQINTGLACSTITLATGAILFTQADITVNGPGKTALTVSGADNRVFRHSGSGTLTLKNLSVANGYYHPSVGVPAYGGCINSSGKVTLDHVSLHACRAASVQAAVRGGGVYARDNVYVKYSEVSGNTASSSNSANSNGGGGGIFGLKDVTIENGSTVSDNSAATGAGGGVRALGSVLVIGSTISGNTAMRGGGVYARNLLTSSSNTTAVVNSTLSGNLGTDLVGGMWTNAGTIDVKNSTIAFNSAGSGAVYSKHYSPGVNIDDLGAYYTDINHYKFKVVTLQSSVFSNNVSGISPMTADDFGITRFSNLNLVGVSGQGNLVFAAGYNTALPQATVTLGVCPLLGPLRDNGGGTKTHALSSGSFAIDHGNNSVPISVDQRGSPFLRVSGAAADIGAYEVQQDDILFNAGFDGCG